MFVCSHFEVHPFARRVMKIALYGEKFTMEQDWEGAIGTAAHTLCLRGHAHFGFMIAYIRSMKLKQLL
jgi:hypothetical protein